MRSKDKYNYLLLQMFPYVTFWISNTLFKIFKIPVLNSRNFFFIFYGQDQIGVNIEAIMSLCTYST